MAANGGTRPTEKFDPKELLGLVAVTAGKERLRPTCEMPKLELAHLLRQPEPPLAARPVPTALAKGSSGIAPLPRRVDGADAKPAAELAPRVFVRTRRARSNARFLVILAACSAAAATVASYLS